MEECVEETVHGQNLEENHHSVMKQIYVRKKCDILSTYGKKRSNKYKKQNIEIKKDSKANCGKV